MVTDDHTRKGEKGSSEIALWERVKNHNFAKRLPELFPING
jgi:hypothetical protein